MRVVLDGKTGDVSQVRSFLLRPDSTQLLPQTETFEDYRDVEGMRIPFRIVYRNEYFGETLIKIDRVITRSAIDDIIFYPSFPIKK